jgi:hypothetical protein
MGRSRNAVNFPTVSIHRSMDNSANGGIEAGTVSTAGQNSDAFDVSH